MFFLRTEKNTLSLLKLMTFFITSKFNQTD
jgi:hypothetical protein